MANKVENRTINVLINEADLKTKQEAAIKRAERLQEKLKNLDPGSQLFKQTAIELQKTNAEAEKYAAVLSGRVAPTQKMLEAEQRRLNKALKEMPIDVRLASEEFKKLGQVNSVLMQVRQSTNTANQSIKNMGKEGGGVFSSLKIGVASVFGGQLLADGFNKLKQFVQEGLQYSKQLEASAANLSALTGLTGSNLQYLQQQAKQLSQSTVEGNIRITKSALDIQEAYTIVGSQRPELLKNKEALAEVTKQALILAEAGKIDLLEAVKGVTTSLNQFDFQGKESARVVNVLAAGSKEGAANILYQAQAFEKSGTAMKQANISFEEGAGLIQTLAPRFASAETAGTNLRNIILKLESATDKNLRPSIAGLIPALENLRKKNMDTAEMAKFFGQENINAATILRENIDEVINYTQAVTNTSVALEQAAINTDTNAAKQAQAENKFKNTAAAIGNLLLPALTAVTDVTSYYLEQLNELIQGETPLTSALQAEQGEFRALMGVIMDANLPIEERKKLIDEVNTKYKDYLPFLIDEKDNYLRLGEALEFANSMFEEKILLSTKEEVIARRRAELADTYDIEILALKTIEKLRQQGIKDDDARIKTQQMVAKQVVDDRAALLKDIEATTKQIDADVQKVVSKRKEFFGDTLPISKNKASINTSLTSTKTNQESTETTLTEAQQKKILADRERFYAHLEELGFKSLQTTLDNNQAELQAIMHKYDKERAQAQKLFTDKAELKKIFNTLEAAEQQELSAKQEQQWQKDLQELDKFFAESLKAADAHYANLKKLNQSVADAEAKNAAQEAAAQYDLLQKTVADENATAQQRINARRQIAAINQQTLTDEQTAQSKALQEQLLNTKLLPEAKAEIATQITDIETATANRRLAIETQLNEDIMAIERAAMERKISQVETFANTAAGIYNSLNQITANNEQQQLNGFMQNRDAELAALENQKTKRLVNDEAYNQRKKQIEDNYRRQEAAIKTKQFERQKTADTIQAIINTAVAVSKTFAQFGFPAGILPAALAAAAGGAQVAAIQSQKAPKFGKGADLRGKGVLHSNPQGGNPIIDPITGAIIGYVEEGEVILSKNTVQNNQPVVDKLLFSSLYNNGATVQIPQFSFPTITQAAPRFANGTLVAASTTQTPPAANATTVTNTPTVAPQTTDSELFLQNLQLNNTLLQQLLQQGITATAVFGDTAVRDITDRQDELGAVNNVANL